MEAIGPADRLPTKQPGVTRERLQSRPAETTKMDSPGERRRGPVTCGTPSLERRRHRLRCHPLQDRTAERSWQVSQAPGEPEEDGRKRSGSRATPLKIMFGYISSGPSLSRASSGSRSRIALTARRPSSLASGAPMQK